MGKHSDRSIPAAMKQFNKLLEQLGYRWDYSRIFDDFLTMTIAYFSRGDELRKQRDDAFKIYNEKEKQVFNQLFYELVNIYKQQIENSGDGGWYDPLGNIYEYLASSSKQSWFGQFFTPETVVDFMVKIQADGEELTGKGLKVNDPACGSGRFLIAFHAAHPGNYTFGEDIDPACAKMTAINMMFHGCEGEVVCHDSLMPDSWRFGYWINPDIRKIAIPTIEPIQKEQSLILKMWENQKNGKQLDVPKPKPVISELNELFQTNKKNQFVLFG